MILCGYRFAWLVYVWVFAAVAAFKSMPSIRVQRMPALRDSNKLDYVRDAAIVAERTLDTIEDAALHLRRQLQQPKLKPTLSQKGDKPRVVILGAGWAGHAIAKIIDTDVFDVVLVSPRNYFLFTPMLTASCVGTVDFRSICEPIRKANPLVGYYEGSCTAIDVHKRSITVEGVMRDEYGRVVSFDIPYDTLVYGVGVASTSFGVPGVVEHCYFIKEIEDAQRLRGAIIDRFELANIPGLTDDDRRRILAFVVVGGGPTGIEFAAALYDLIVDDIPKYFPSLFQFVSLKIIQSSNSILEIFEASLQAKGIQKLQKLGIEILLQSRVLEVRDREILLKNGQTVSYGLCAWAAGTGPRNITLQLLSNLEEQREAPGAKRGQLTVDGYMRVLGTNGTMLALGDCAHVQGERLPGTGQVAAQQGAYVARLLNRGYNLTKPIPAVSDDGDVAKLAANYVRLRGKLQASPFQFLNLGVLAYIGDDKALAQVSAGDIQLLSAAGDVGYLLWRSTYLVKQVSVRNRVLVLFDWLKSRLFGRDITRF